MDEIIKGAGMRKRTSFKGSREAAETKRRARGGRL